jgi:hypothetical protein
MKLSVFILNEQRYSSILDVDGISGKTYRFRWNQHTPKEIGSCYTYEPKNQEEINDIMQSQAHAMFFFSIFVEGAFECSKADKPAEVKKVVRDYGDLDKLPLNEIVAAVEAMDDKEALIALIEKYDGIAPAKQSGIAKFQKAAIEAIGEKIASESEESEPELEI